MFCYSFLLSLFLLTAIPYSFLKIFFLVFFGLVSRRYECTLFQLFFVNLEIKLEAVSFNPKSLNLLDTYTKNTGIFIKKYFKNNPKQVFIYFMFHSSLTIHILTSPTMFFAAYWTTELAAFDYYCYWFGLTCCYYELPSRFGWDYGMLLEEWGVVFPDCGCLLFVLARFISGCAAT